MLTLREFQQQFVASLFSDGEPDPALARLVEANGLTAARRIGIHRNNLYASLVDSLAATYPAIRALVGSNRFRALARRYIGEHPSRSGDLQAFGAQFDSFVATDTDCASLPWISDLARLEWAYHRVFHAAEEQALAPAALASFEQAQHERLVLRLHPASAAVESRFPLAAIWRLGIHGNESSDDVDLDMGPEFLLVARRNLQMTFQSLSRAEHAFVTAMSAARPLGACVEAALGVDEQFDAGRCLARQFSLGNVTGVSINGTAPD